MKKGFLRFFVLISVIVLVLSAAGGCSKKEEEANANAKKIQVLELENKELREKLEAGKKEYDTQMQVMGNEVIKMFEENMQLQADVNNLKKQIEQLKAAQPK